MKLLSAISRATLDACLEAMLAIPTGGRHLFPEQASG